MSVYINGIGAISPQGCFPDEDFMKTVNNVEQGPLTVIEPLYREYISVVKLRRMSKVIKMGLASALMCLNDSQSGDPDAIITATGLGSVGDTDKFLANLIDNNENLLNPTPFIQSTHNAVAARIAIETGCHNYNMTYVHKNSALENALFDAIMKIESGKYKNIILGGTDEITESDYRLKTHVDFWKENTGNAELLENSNTKGTIAGEGSVFLNLSAKKTSNSYAEVKGVKTYYKLQSDVKDAIREFIASAQLEIQDIDLIVLGKNGNVEEDYIYQDITDAFIKSAGISWYKHLCGEYETAVGFAILMSSYILKTQLIPKQFLLSDKPSQEVKNILIYQHRFNRNHSFTLLSKC